MTITLKKTLKLFRTIYLTLVIRLIRSSIPCFVKSHITGRKMLILASFNSQQSSAFLQI